jgi:hypothetical protein
MEAGGEVKEATGITSLEASNSIGEDPVRRLRAFESSSDISSHQRWLDPNAIPFHPHIGLRGTPVGKMISIIAEETFGVLDASLGSSQPQERMGMGVEMRLNEEALMDFLRSSSVRAR